MVRMAQKKESADCEYLTNGDIGAGMSFLGDLEPATGNEVRDRDTEPGKVDRSQTKEACEEDDDIDDDVAMTFPQRLMEILDDPGNADILSWLHHGRGFVIYRKKAFEQRLLPKYFNKQSKYSSFTRKLNRWGFSRVTRGPEAGAYYHQFFQRGGHRLVMQMSCQSTNKIAADTTLLKAGTHTGLSGVSSAPLSSIMPGMGPIAPSTFNLSALVLENLGISQQQQQLMQFQIQQQLLQQEAACRALFASSSSIAGMPSWQPGIPPVSMHSLPDHQGNVYSQLLAAHLAQGVYNTGNMSLTNNDNSHSSFPDGGAGAAVEGINNGIPPQNSVSDKVVCPRPLPPPT